MNEETIYEGTAQNKVNPNAAQNVNNDESTILETAARLKNGETKVAPEGKEKTSKGNKKSDNAWINVTLGGVSGILLGAGLMYGANAFSQGKEPDGETVEPDNGGSSTPPVEPQQVNVAPSADDMSFGDAFAAARAAVGPDGVFVWHGGVYSTHTAEEWNAMSHQQQDETVAQVPVATPAGYITTPPNDINPQVDPQPEPLVNQGDEVMVVGTGQVGGHVTSYIDVNGDGEADIAIIDIDDNQQLSDVDIVTDGQNYATVSGLRDNGVGFEGNPYNMENDNVLAGNDDSQSIPDGSVGDGATDTTEGTDSYLATLENPETAPDMPDYMDDAVVDA
ncbi:MAG: hypothetical protein IJ183_02225 [Prevotella sp.]|nr:hypothetical protein [Prevotella sp.]